VLTDLAAHIKQNGGKVDFDTFRMATSSGRGIGKSALVSWLTLWMLSTRIGSTTIISANSESQLRSVTWAEITKWLASPQGQQDVKDLVEAFVSMAKAINATVGALIALKHWWDENARAAKKYNDEVFLGSGSASGIGGRRFFGSGTGTPSTPSGPTTPADRQGARVTVNFNTPVDSVSAGREIARVLSDFNRVGGVVR
jgi:hypothetical protein